MNLSGRLAAIEKRTNNQAGPIVLVPLGEERPTDTPPGAVILIETEEDRKPDELP